MTPDLKDFLDYVTELDWPFEAGEIYGRIRADLREIGCSEKGAIIPYGEH